MGEGVAGTLEDREYIHFLGLIIDLAVFDGWLVSQVVLKDKGFKLLFLHYFVDVWIVL